MQRNSSASMFRILKTAIRNNLIRDCITLPIGVRFHMHAIHAVFTHCKIYSLQFKLCYIYESWKFEVALSHTVAKFCLLLFSSTGIDHTCQTLGMQILSKHQHNTNYELFLIILKIIYS